MKINEALPGLVSHERTAPWQKQGRAESISGTGFGVPEGHLPKVVAIGRLEQRSDLHTFL